MRKKLLMTTTIGLMCVLCYGCGNTASTKETNATVGTSAAAETATTLENNSTVEATTSEQEPEAEKTYLTKKMIYKDSEGNITGTRDYEYVEGTDNISKEIYTDDEGKEVITYEYYDNGVLKYEEALGNEGSLWYSKEYNEDGLCIKDTSDFSEEIYTYENGVKASVIRTQYGDDGKVEFYTVETCNEYGDVIEEIFTGFENGVEQDVSEVYYEYEYNSDGFMTKCTRRINSGYTVTEYTLDSDGNVTSEIETDYFNDGNPTGYYSTMQDDGKNKVETHYNKDGSVSYCFETERDNNGNIIVDTSTFYEDDGSVETCYKTEYEYDENNNETKYINYTNDEIDSYTELTYDENNNIVKRVSTDQDGNVEEICEMEYIEVELPKAEQFITETDMQN